VAVVIGFSSLAAVAVGIEVTWLYRRRGHFEESIAGEPCYTRNPPANPRRGRARISYRNSDSRQLGTLSGHGHMHA
jgi:hypothetical protein